MSVPQDIKLTEDRSFEMDGGGDLATVTDQEFVKQEPVVRLFNEVSPQIGETVTRRFLERLESDIQRVLNNSEWVEPPFNIYIEPLDTETVAIDIETANEEITTTRTIQEFS